VDVALLYRWVTVIDDIKFEFNNIISLNTKNDSDRRQFVSLGYVLLHQLYYYYFKKNEEPSIKLSNFLSFEHFSIDIFYGIKTMKKSKMSNVNE